MTLRSHRFIAPALAVLLATSACAAHVVPSSDNAANPTLQVSSASYSRPADTTSILKRLTKDVTIGSTIDTKNGDKGPRALYIVPCDCSGVLTKGQLVTCNFEDKAGVAGDGTTIEILDPASNSKPVRFAQNKLLKGCDGAALTSINQVYGAGLTSGKLVEYSNKGIAEKTYSGQPITAPFSDTDGLPKQQFSPEYIFAGTTAGGIVSIGIGFYGNGVPVQVAEGFAVTKGSKDELAPSGLQYDKGIDTLYIVDGASNTIVAFSNASELLDENEIVVEPGGKTFKCKYPKVTCASLVKSGKPLDAPIASTVLPNGNLIVANTEGTANTLVELTPQGQVLDTKVVDKSSTQGVFGIAAAGTNDDNTVLFFTDTDSNTVQELEQ